MQEVEAVLAVDALPAREQQIRAQQNQVAADRAALAEAEWRLEQKQIASPRAGLVFDTLYRQGEWVAAGNPVVQLLPPENLEVRFFVPEPVVGKAEDGREHSGAVRWLLSASLRDHHVHFAAVRVHAAGDLQQRESLQAGFHDHRSAEAGESSDAASRATGRGDAPMTARCQSGSTPSMCRDLNKHFGDKHVVKDVSLARAAAVRSSGFWGRTAAARRRPSA